MFHKPSKFVLPSARNFVKALSFTILHQNRYFLTFHLKCHITLTAYSLKTFCKSESICDEASMLYTQHLKHKSLRLNYKKHKVSYEKRERNSIYVVCEWMNSDKFLIQNLYTYFYLLNRKELHISNPNTQNLFKYTSIFNISFSMILLSALLYFML